MEEQKTENTDWLKQELEETKNTAFDEDRAPALKLEENKITEITIDFTNPFEKWTDQESGVVKKIIPVESKGEKFVWWLNTRNPVYHKIVELGVKGQKVFKVLQTGNKQNTKYTLVD